MANKYYFSTKDLLLIAILCCLGGVMSTYVGYLGSTLGSLTGIPMGGQLLSGLHVFWIVLVLVLVNKKGAGITAGILKGFIEFATGSHLGLLVIPTSLLEGIFAEIGFWPFKKYRALAYPIAGGLSAWANVMVTQTIFNAFPGTELFISISLLALASGIIFGGYMSLAIVRVLEEGGLSRKPDGIRALKPGSIPGVVLAALVIFMIAIFASHFAPYVLPSGDAAVPGNETQTAGHIYFFDVSKGFGNKSYDLMDYQSQFITITATDPSGGNIVASNYTGLPMVDLVNMQCPGGSPRYLEVFRKDGSSKRFNVPEIRKNQSMLIVPNGSSMDIVAPGYPAEMWVKNADNFKQY